MKRNHAKNRKFTILPFILVILLFASCHNEQPQKQQYPMFWTWLDYRPNANFDSICAVMQATGIDGVMLNAPSPDDYRKAIPIAHKYGIEVYAWLWTMNLEHDRNKIVREHPDWLSVNRKGESLADTKAYVDYYKFMCPALPEVREHIRKKISAYCEVEGLNGIAIDYHRFVDVILPTTLWPRYGIVQDREYPEWDYGYHPAMIKLFEEKHGYDPRAQEDPSADEKWLQFRCDQITEVANEIADVVHSHGKVMAASPFPTPAMSRQMVRQDWGKWNLDIVFPMVYYNFYTGDVSFISDCTAENVRDKNPQTVLYCGMTGVNGPAMFDCMNAALNNGAEGIAIFTVNSLRSPEIRAQFKAYADSVRALRQNGQFKPAENRNAANANPFENEGIMNAVQMRMTAYLSAAKTSALSSAENMKWTYIEPFMNSVLSGNSADEYLNRLQNSSRRNADLKPLAEALAAQFEHDMTTLKINTGEYELIDRYGATRCYQTTEQESGVMFNVTFYFYGGILSGWDVKPEEITLNKFRNSLISKNI